ncbi:MAG TPA: ammonium transporter [Xanthomonadales bacterium]|nr:ammonium transporter [Xanthomonadales bacterium]
MDGFKRIFLKRYALMTALMLLPALAWGQEADVLDTGDTAWMLTATALVLLMTIPGLALFYGGLVRSKNVLSVLGQCFAITGMASVLWYVIGYGLAFGDGGAFFGTPGDKLFLVGVTADSMTGTIPETVFATFQMTFAVITPALIVGGFAERMKFSSMMLFMAAWLLLVYAPVCHWVWGGGWISTHGALDFAGGTVVHINAGIAALVAALVLGKRRGYPKAQMRPNNLGYTVIGASLLWVGWFGFNAGSALGANGTAGMAMLVTQIASAMAALTWMFVEWIRHGKPSVLGIATGAVAGLVAITPACGVVGPMGAIFIGFAGGFCAFWASTSLKRRFSYDDSLDVFGVHGSAGIIGALLTGVFCAEQFGGAGFGSDEITTIGGQLWAQGIGVVATIIYGGVASYIILKVVGQLTGGLRVNEEDEVLGLDLALHDEQGYNL